jgi:hypothetical protein
MLTSIMQGGVLSSCYFAIFVDDLVNKVLATNEGCYTERCLRRILFADDTILLASYKLIGGLQRRLGVCEEAIEAGDY